jgi:hypothetical protein
MVFVSYIKIDNTNKKEYDIYETYPGYEECYIYDEWGDELNGELSGELESKK